MYSYSTLNGEFHRDQALYPQFRTFVPCLQLITWGAQSVDSVFKPMEY